MWKWMSAAALVLSIAASGYAADLDTEVGELLVVLRERVDGGAGGKELKQLNKAVKKLEKKPDPSVNDLKKVLLGVSKSGTADDAVLSEAADVLQCLCDLVEGKADLVASEATKIVTQKLLDKLEGKTSSALEKLQLAKSFLETDPVKATKLLVGAAKKYDKALAAALKFVRKDAPKPPPNGIQIFSGFGGIYFANNTGKPHNVRDVLISLSLRDAAGEVVTTASASAKRLVPENFRDFANRVFPGSLYDVSEYLWPTLPDPASVSGVVRIQGSARVLLGDFAPFDIPIDAEARLYGY